jgi:hypothetical protein
MLLLPCPAINKLMSTLNPQEFRIPIRFFSIYIYENAFA